MFWLTASAWSGLRTSSLRSGYLFCLAAFLTLDLGLLVTSQVVDGADPLDFTPTGKFENASNSKAVRRGCADLLNVQQCNTIWEWMICSQSDYGFNITTSAARRPDVRLDLVLADPDTSLTFFAAPDDHYRDIGASPADDQSSGVLSKPFDSVNALFTFLYMSLPGQWTQEDLTALPYVNTASHQTWQLYLSSTLRYWDGVLALTFKQDNVQQQITVEETLKNYTQGMYSANILKAFPACNGMFYIVDKHWSRVVLTQNGELPSGYNQTLNKNKVISYHPRCSSAMNLDEMLSVAWLWSNDTTWQWALADVMQQFINTTVGELSMGNMSFTWLLPRQYVPLPLPLNATVEEVAQQVSWLLYHMLPGAWCPQDLVVSGEVNTLLGVVAGQQATLKFVSTSTTTVRIDYPSGTNAGWLERPLTHCRTVVYGLNQVPAAPNTTIESGANPSQLLQLPFVLPVDLAPTNLTGVWHIIQQATQHLKTTPGLCARKYPRIRDLSFNDTILPPREGSDNDAMQNQWEELQPETSTTKKIVVAVCVLLSVALVSVVVGAYIAIQRQRRRHAQQLTASQASQGSHDDPAVLHKLGGHGMSTDEVEIVVKATSLQRDYITEPEMMIAVGQVEPGTANMFYKIDSAVPSLESSASLRQVLDGVEHNWVIPSHQLKYLRKIGSGSFGEVYGGQWNSTTVAIKKLPHEIQQSPQELKRFLDSAKALQKEVSIMAGLRHPNVVLLLGVCVDPPAIVTEYCERGSLYSVIQGVALSSQQLLQFDWRRRIQLALEAATGMEFLHSRSPPVLHCDLKSPNLLVDKAWHVKVADFGLSRMMVDTAMSRSSLVVMNPKWLAPEVIQNHERSTAADVYAFGIILWELLSLAEPFEDMQPIQIAFAVVNNKIRPSLPDDLDTILGGSFTGMDEYIALMQLCWHQDPSQRPSFQQVVQQLKAIRKIVHASYSTSSSHPTLGSSIDPLVS